MKPIAVVTDNRQRALLVLDDSTAGVAEYYRERRSGVLASGEEFVMVDELKRIEGREFSKVWVCGSPPSRLIHAAKLRVR